MLIEIWSDVVCPWCYVGKRRLEKALPIAADRAGFDPAEVEIRWHSFQLDPAAPAVAVETVAESLGRKYGGGPEAGRRMIDQMEALAAEEGLLFRHHASLRVNTADAHRLLHLAAREHGSAVQGTLKEALLAAYFVETENVADHDTLRRIAVAAGLGPERVDAVLAGAEFAAEVEADQEAAYELGAGGVPFLVIDRRFAVVGAQSVEAFADVLVRAWREAHPTLSVLGSEGGTGEVCGPDGCD